MNRLSVSACKATVIIAGSSSSCTENALVEMLLAVKETRGSKYYQVKITNKTFFLISDIPVNICIGAMAW